MIELYIAGAVQIQYFLAQTHVCKYAAVIFDEEQPNGSCFKQHLITPDSVLRDTASPH